MMATDEHYPQAQQQQKQDEDEDEQIESSLRRFLRAKPRNARATSRLSCLLSESAKTSASACAADGRTSREEDDEALSLALRAVDLAPSKSYGHVALSSCASYGTHGDRMGALRRALDLPPLDGSSGRPQIGRLLGLMRLLIEPREEEARVILLRNGTKGGKGGSLGCGVGGYIGRASPLHPNRRDLDEGEAELYDKTCLAAKAIPGTATTRERLLLARVEYKLGMFFRKLRPHDTHRPRAVQHLRRAATVLPPDHTISKKATFWLATFADAADRPDGGAVASDECVVVERCPEEYVVGLYSTFASNFDDLLLNKLQYRTPSLLRLLVDGALPPQLAAKKGTVWAARVADLGCGTGLSGLAFRDCAGYMVGVDLSPEMIVRATERGCYDEVVVGDVESIFVRRKEEDGGVQLVPTAGDCSCYDLVFACDVFVYIGDLSSIFASVRESLTRPDGLFAFSTECLEEGGSAAVGDNDCPYLLQPCARFAHRRSYIESLAEDFGFVLKAIKTCPIRKNEGNDVKGILAVLGLPPNT